MIISHAPAGRTGLGTPLPWVVDTPFAHVQHQTAVFERLAHLGVEFLRLTGRVPVTAQAVISINKAR